MKAGLSIAIGAFASLCLVAGSARAQEPTGSREPDEAIFPNHGFLVTGYGAAGYRATFAQDETPNNFSALLAPIFLFQISDRFLFEGEVEFELEEGVTVASLEYAQIDISMTDNLRLVFGKFLLPFNTFTERLHPTWINPFVSTPAIYGGHGAAAPTDPLLPILSDVGAQLRGGFALGDAGFLTGALFVSQGPRPEAEEHQEGEEEGEAAVAASFAPAAGTSLFGGSSGEVGEVAFGDNFDDNNENKMVGGRLGVGIAPYVELNVSAMTGAYDDAGDLDFTTFGAHLEARHRGFLLHGEWVRTEQEVFDEEEPQEVVSLNRDGYYVMLGYQYGKWQPLVRWSQIFDGDLEGESVVDSGNQLALGVAYWLRPSLVLKGEYLLNYEGEADRDNNRLAVQWGFGF